MSTALPRCMTVCLLRRMQLLDSQIPARRVTCRRRPSSAWFDDECRQAKLSLRTAERAARKAGPHSDTSLSTVSEWQALRCHYFSLLRQKRAAFWSSKIDADQRQPSRLWRSFDELLGRERTPVVTDISASVLYDFFDDKVAAVRAATANADPPHLTSAPAGCVLNEFLPITPADVVELINALPDKQSATDPLPTWLLKRSADVLAPFLCQLFNLSLQHGCVPLSFKASYITPLLIKIRPIDPADVRFCRPTSNLTVISKLLERIVSSRLVKYLKDKGLLSDLHSAYRAMHSTETSVLKVFSDIRWHLTPEIWQC